MRVIFRNIFSWIKDCLTFINVKTFVFEVFYSIGGLEAFPVARVDGTDAAFTCCQKI